MRVHLTRGRVAWNIVTSHQRSATANLGLGELVPHDERYHRADEFMDVVYALWEGTFEPDALVADPDAGVYLDHAKVHGAGHEGFWFSVPGPGPTLPGRKGTPSLFQAGSLSRGLAFAARHAEAHLLSGTSPENVRRLTDALPPPLADSGRSRDDVWAITSVTVIAAVRAGLRRIRQPRAAGARPPGRRAGAPASSEAAAPASRTLPGEILGMDVLRADHPGAAFRCG